MWSNDEFSSEINNLKPEKIDDENITLELITYNSIFKRINDIIPQKREETSE
jgi:hypothetical protein